MLSSEVIKKLLRKFERRLEGSLQSRTSLAGIASALEFTVAEAQDLRARLEKEGARAFAIRGYMQAVMPWEKIHV
jgi:hypothetical protein